MKSAFSLAYKCIITNLVRCGYIIGRTRVEEQGSKLKVEVIKLHEKFI